MESEKERDTNIVKGIVTQKNKGEEGKHQEGFDGDSTMRDNNKKLTTGDHRGRNSTKEREREEVNKLEDNIEVSAKEGDLSPWQIRALKSASKRGKSSQHSLPLQVKTRSRKVAKVSQKRFPNDWKDPFLEHQTKAGCSRKMNGRERLLETMGNTLP
ncbi:hypothetical protein H5410_056011 [Solanum commersonii]|uniref:Uncharacterized protein n=1 Tax=Solanum commersonii TaxID=4109 RepID=A0A9J5WKG1_SOLCO|nr:hypothetical protein H5410_056011 [Solanum commersonii]